MAKKKKEKEEKELFVRLRVLKTAVTGFSPMILIIMRRPSLLLQLLWPGKGSTKEYKSPKLPYKIPEYREDMECCSSQKKYLKPTYLCDSNAPEIIAVANQLGAFKKSAREYAEEVFHLVNDKIVFGVSGIKKASETLRRGDGSCLDKMTLFIALCRAGGLPARYKLFSSATIEKAYNIYIKADPLMRAVYDTLGYFPFHGAGEVNINGEWFVCDVTASPEDAAGIGIPLARFGEDLSGVLTFQIGKSMRLERLPRGIKLMSKLQLPTALSTMTAIFEENRKKGAEILKEMGKEAYDQKVRKSFRPVFPRITLKKGLVKDYPT